MKTFFAGVFRVRSVLERYTGSAFG